MTRRIDPTDWMWAQACDMLAGADRMHGQFFRLSVTRRSQAVWEPPIDVFEDEDEVVAVVAMPGVAADAVELVRDERGLTVRGHRPSPFAGSQHVVRQLEIPYGFFERRVPLPPVPLELVSHELTHGCLVLRLRKAR
jgi:HSP20 family molecular chaperone IbpA